MLMWQCRDHGLRKPRFRGKRRAAYCDLCNKLNNKAWYLFKGRESSRERARRWYEANREYKIEYQRQRRLKRKAA